MVNDPGKGILGRWAAVSGRSITAFIGAVNSIVQEKAPCLVDMPIQIDGTKFWP
jgi:hypothetical protein